MKSTFTLLLCVVFSYNTSYSQACITTVHSNSEAIKKGNSGQRNGSSDKYWVCNGGSLILNGDRNYVYVDRGGVLSVSGDSNYVYARFHLVDTTILTIAGNYNFVDIDKRIVQAGFYSDNGVNTTKKNCEPMNFDYSVAPSGGCEFWVGLEGVTVVKAAKIYPSPANDILYLVFPKEEIGDYSIQLYDLMGKLVFSNQGNQRSNQIEIDVSALPIGTYIVRMESGNVMINEQIIVQR